MHFLLVNGQPTGPLEALARTQRTLIVRVQMVRPDVLLEIALCTVILVAMRAKVLIGILGHFIATPALAIGRMLGIARPIAMLQAVKFILLSALLRRWRITTSNALVFRFRRRIQSVLE